jgi:hypothetical protein
VGLFPEKQSQVLRIIKIVKATTIESLRKLLLGHTEGGDVYV